MILLIARRELLGHLRSPRLRALFALVVALLALGAYGNVRRYQGRLRYADALEALRTVTAALGGNDPESVATRHGWRTGHVDADPALRAVRRPAPASMFASGADLGAPGYWQFGTEGVRSGPNLADDDAATATLDLEFVVRVVLSLVALLLTAESIAGERERGVLRTLFAAPVSRVDVLVAKYVGGLLALCVPLAVGGAASIAVVGAMDAPLLARDVLPRLLMLAGASIMFLSTMVALGTCVSAVARDAQTAVVVLVTLWAIAVVIVPGGATLLADAVHPVTPVELQRQRAVDELRQIEADRMRSLAQIWRRVAGTDEVPSATSLGDGLRQAYDDARRPLENELMRRKRMLLRGSLDQVRRERDTRNRVASWLGAISPASQYQSLASEVVGTGPVAVGRWERAADDHQHRLESAVFDRQYGTELFARNLGYLHIAYMPNQSDPREHVPRYDELPAFAPPESSLATDLRAAVPPLASLIASNLLLLALGGVAVVRMEM